MKLRNLFLTAMLLFAGLAYAQMPDPIPADTAIRVGKLDNGLTYYIRYNNWPEHRANFYIAQKVGSIQEEESQRGLAHFLEHMCFNGTDNFKGNDVVSYCEKIGVQFGSDLNAYTSIDQTVYRICNVPTARQSALDSCLLILRDWADGLLLEPEEIDKERGVIHEEWRLRSSASMRLFERNLPALYPGSKYGERFPIGLMSVIDNFSYQELRDYYEKWYHPKNQGIIVVGDVDINKTEETIRTLFGPIKNPDVVAPIVDEPVPDTAEPIVIIDHDKELRASDVDIMFKHDVFPQELRNTDAFVLYNYMKNAATGMLRSRLNEAAQKEGCPFVNASAYDGTYIYAKTKDAFTVSVTPKDPSQIEAAMTAALIEARKAAEFGFTSTEYDRFKADYLSSLEKSYSNRDKRTNDQLYGQMVSNFLEGDAMPSIDYTFAKMNELVPMIPLEYINAVMAELLPKNDSNMVIINFNTEEEGRVYPTKDALLAAVNAARTADIQAFVDEVRDEPLVARLPKPGKIKKETKNDALGYTEWILSNGVKVLLKPTDFKKDQVMLSGVGEGGSSLYGMEDRVNCKVFNDVIGICGLGNFSSTELEKVLAGKIANANLYMSEHNMTLNGSSTPNDVETMLQMAYLYFTGINKDENAYQNLMSQYEVAMKNRALSPDVALSDSVTVTLYDHNPRFAPLTIDDLGSINYDRILKMAAEQTATAQGWTFNIIGNFDIDSIKPLVLQYLGGLPAKKKPVKGHRIQFLAKGNVDNIFTRKQETPKCTAIVVWYTEDLEFTNERAIQADMVGQIMRMIYTKEIREEASAAYSVGAYGNAGIDEFVSNYTLIAQCPMKPEKRDTAMLLLNGAVERLAVTCDNEMLTKVKEVMLKRAEQNEKSNGYWNNILVAWTRFGIDEHTDYKALVEAQTPEKISAFVKDLLKAGNKITVMMTPEEE